MAIRCEVGVPQPCALVAQFYPDQTGRESSRFDSACANHCQRYVIDHIHQAVQGFVAVAAAPGLDAVIDSTYQLRARDRQRKLVSKIDAALRRIDSGEKSEGVPPPKKTV